jgi:ribonuclease HII
MREGDGIVFQGGLVCGIDEAGRGPLAGPVTAAAVILPQDFPVETLADSKKLTERQREDRLHLILQMAVAYGVGWAWHFEIDKINILRASLLAMKRAYEGLSVRPDIVLVDGLYTPEIPGKKEAIVRGDAAVPAIMAASILAKTARDRWMVRHSLFEPGYGFEKHKGYPTALHRERITALGNSSIQRLTFKVKGEENSDAR